MGVQLAKAMGMRVIGVDGGKDKQALCLRLGCEAYVDFQTTNNIVDEVVRMADGKGVHGVFVTATSPSAYAAATKMARIGGRVMCVGMPPLGTTIAGDDPMYLILRNLKVVGTLTGSLRDTSDALAFAARGLLNPIYERVPIDRLPEAVSRLRAGNVQGRLVVDFNSG
jgi:propanol-preferring alcohol dehydrogenase